MLEPYIPVVGLEVHIELSTKSKMFCACASEHFGKKPNTQVCPICLGLPGALPFINKEAVISTVKLGLALNCKVSSFSKFDRKHYFYPDLPKGYQISQYDLPFCKDGKWNSKGGQQIRIRRIHIEEDTGKLIHTTLNGKKVSLIDFNRSGVALVELVSEPDFDSIELVDEFLKDIQQVVRYLQISSADMEEGSMRLEANVSMQSQNSKLKTQNLPDYKVELKNINSFRFLRKALEAEIKRQEGILSSGRRVTQETRGWDETKGTTFSQRTKEEAQDYRYFPEPDLPPLEITKEEVANYETEIPELPWKKRLRYKETLGLSEAYIDVISEEPEIAKYFESAVEAGKRFDISPKEIAGAIVNLHMHKTRTAVGLIKKLLEITKKEYASDSEVEIAIVEVLEREKKAAEDYNKGKGEVLGFLIGQVQKTLKGKGNPKIIKDILIDKLRI